MSKVLCSIATRGRYFTTLPLVITAIMNQTQLPDKLIIFDDNDEPKDMREKGLYQNLFYVLDSKGIAWEWLFAHKKGQHHIHQIANTMGYEFVWRVDDDAVPEPNALETLCKHLADDVGAVGGTIMNPPQPLEYFNSTGLIEKIDQEPNIQWGLIKEKKRVEHLYQSFIYRAGVHDYNLGLSRVGFREETIFTYGLHQKGYKLFVVPNAISWHLKDAHGGIRTEKDPSLYDHDNQIFKNYLAMANGTIVVLNCGLGDHIVFSKVLLKIKNARVFTCYPDVIQGESIATAMSLYGDIEQWNIYKKMDQWKWKGSLQEAFEKMYL